MRKREPQPGTAQSAAPPKLKPRRPRTLFGDLAMHMEDELERQGYPRRFYESPTKQEDGK